MGKSQETFGKKEREKKKRKKKEEKARRREDRKAHSGDKGDNITYMDAFGKFHDSPPPPPEKVKAKDIELGIPEQQDQGDDSGGVRKGVVSFFNHEKGYGFIRDKKTEESIFVHINNTTEEIRQDNMVTFETEMGPKGPSAINVKVMR